MFGVKRTIPLGTVGCEVVFDGVDETPTWFSVPQNGILLSRGQPSSQDGSSVEKKEKTAIWNGSSGSQKLLFDNPCSAQHEVTLEQHEVDAFPNELEFRACVPGGFVDGEQ